MLFLMLTFKLWRDGSYEKLEMFKKGPEVRFIMRRHSLWTALNIPTYFFAVVARRPSLAKWKFCVHADKRAMLQEMTSHVQDNKNRFDFHIFQIFRKIYNFFASQIIGLQKIR